MTLSKKFDNVLYRFVMCVMAVAGFFVIDFFNTSRSNDSKTAIFMEEISRNTAVTAANFEGKFSTIDKTFLDIDKTDRRQDESIKKNRESVAYLKDGYTVLKTKVEIMESR